MSAESSNAGQQAEGGGRPQRSVGERVIVWGLILGLGLVAFLEWRAKTSWQKSLAAIEAKFGDEGLTLAEGRALISGNPSELKVTKEGVHNQVISFRWSGALGFWKSYSIRLLVDPGDENEDERIVLYDIESDPNVRMNTHVAEIAEGPNTDDPQLSEEAPAGSGQPGGNRGGRRGGRRPRSFEEIDANKDQKISKDEASTGMQRFFDRIDGNGDGVLDKEEFDQMRSQFSNRGGRGSGRGGQDDQSQRSRPEPDEATETKDDADADAKDSGQPADAKKAKESDDS